MTGSLYSERVAVELVLIQSECRAEVGALCAIVSVCLFKRIASVLFCPMQTRRSRQSARPLARPLSVRERIAKRLGLARTPGSSLPLMRHVDLGTSRYSRESRSQGQGRGPAHGLSIFGDRDELVSLDGRWASFLAF